MAHNLEALMGTPENPKDCLFRLHAFCSNAVCTTTRSYPQVLHANYYSLFEPILDAMASHTRHCRTDFLYDFLDVCRKVEELDQPGELFDEPTFIAAFGVHEHGCDHDNFVAQRWPNREKHYSNIFAIYATKCEGRYMDVPALALYEIIPAR